MYKRQEEYQSLPNREQRELANWLLQQGVTPVSYTHLQRPAQPYNNGENYPAAPERKPVIEREKTYEFDDILTGTGVLEIMPVSYTHLDVYKRQAVHGFADR